MEEQVVIVERPSIRRSGVVALAKRLGRSHSHVSRILAGERKPGKKLGAKLAGLGVNLPPASSDK
jgi:transcriptional regulator with XRE-family HTH domain